MNWHPYEPQNDRPLLDLFWQTRVADEADGVADWAPRVDELLQQLVQQIEGLKDVLARHFPEMAAELGRAPSGPAEQ